MEKDLITTISFAEYKKNLWDSGLYYPSLNLLNIFPSEIQITRSGIKNVFEQQRYSLMHEIFKGVGKAFQPEILKEFYKNLPSLGTEARYSAFSFADTLIKISSEEQLAENIKYILPNFKTTKKFILDLAKKFKDSKHSNIVQELYSSTKDAKLKKQLLKYLPTAAVALSEKDYELRERAKKSLGLTKGRNVNYRNRIRQAFKKALEIGLPSGKFRKYDTCTYTLASPIITKNSKEELLDIRISWKDNWAVNTDPNKIYFEIKYRATDTKYWTRGSKYIKVEDNLGLDFLHVEVDRYGRTYSLAVLKSDWKKLVDWIKKDFIKVVKNH